MYLGKHDAYSILNTTQTRWAVTILLCCDREATSGGGTKCACKKLSCQHRSRSVHTKTLNSPKSKKQCVCHTLHCWHSRRSPHGLSSSRFFWNSRSYPIHHYLTNRQNSTNISEIVGTIQLSIGVRGGRRCSTWYRSWTLVAYHLLELRDDKVCFHGVTPHFTLLTLRLSLSVSYILHRSDKLLILKWSISKRWNEYWKYVQQIVSSPLQRFDEISW